MKKGFLPEQPENEKKHRGILVLFLVILSVMLLLVSATVVLWINGRNASRRVSAEFVDSLPGTDSVSLEESDSSEKNKDKNKQDQYAVSYGDKLYVPKRNMMTILVIGVDQDSPDSVESVEYRTDARADALLLGILDFDQRKLSFLTISRDSMCEYATYDKNGTYTGRGYGQLALSYRYGADAAQSCEITCQAVSDLMSGIPIDAYGALYLQGIGIINDSVGGITLPCLETFDEFTEGEEVTLNGEQAYRYLRTRELTEVGNIKRMERQKQYLKALMQKCISTAKTDISSVLRVYNAASDYTVTNLDTSRILYLATSVMDFDIDSQINSIPGTIAIGESGFVEYTIDEQALTEMILSLYYDELE